MVVTSDSDFSGLCHKLRERGGFVHIVGESKTPATLFYEGNFSDYEEWKKKTLGEAATQSHRIKYKCIAK